MFICKSRPWKCKRTAFESILAEKVSFHFFGLGSQARTCENIWKKIYFENPQILCSIATADPENARQQNSNRFWLKQFPFNFWLKAAGADLQKVLKKIYFENPPILWSIANRFWLKKFRFIFWLKAAGADLRKVLKKIYFENPQISCSIATAGHENANEQHSNQFWLKKFHSIFWHQVAGADLWKNLKKIYFENPPILCSIATAGPENAREQNSNRFWLKKFSFIFWLKPAGGDLWKNLKKKIFWKSTKFMFNCNSRPWICKRTEFESILVEKVSFHFLAQGRRRGPVKKSEKNIFWKSTNFMFNSNSRPWKCKRTEFDSILVEKVSSHFLAQGCRPGPAKSSEKNIFWKSTIIIFICESRPYIM